MYYFLHSEDPEHTQLPEQKEGCTPNTEGPGTEGKVGLKNTVLWL